MRNGKSVGLDRHSVNSRLIGNRTGGLHDTYEYTVTMIIGAGSYRDQSLPEGESGHIFQKGAKADIDGVTWAGQTHEWSFSVTMKRPGLGSEDPASRDYIGPQVQIKTN